jgi:hypothetical protein
VRDVMVAGELVVAARRLTHIDQRQLASEASVAAERLWRRLEQTPPHDFEPKGGRRWPSPLVSA